MRQTAGVSVTVGIPTRNRSGWLRESILSVLGQSFQDFKLIVSDNASTDDTASIVASLADERVEYFRAASDIGMFANVNRVIDAVTTPYLVILPDDDVLYPDYLSSAMALIDAEPSVGVVHSSFDLIAEDGRLLRAGYKLVSGRGPVVRESGRQLIERGMRRSGIVCWTSALFRTEALSGAGGLREHEKPYADGPLMMRIALSHDFACLTQSLVAVRMHGRAESAAVAGSFNGIAYDPDETMAERLLEQRLSFLDEAKLPTAEDRRYRALAIRTFRGDTVGRLTTDVGARRSPGATLRSFVHYARRDYRVLFVPATLKLAAALIAGRRLIERLEQLAPRR
jgi:glycosyltransferase involved in cell wall biosynthesis